MQLRTSLVLLAVLLLGVPAAAQASGNDVIRDCAQDGMLNRHYSQKELEQAYKNLPSDIDEYTDCRSIIRGAMGGGSGSRPARSGGSGSGPAGKSPTEVVTPSGAVAGAPNDVKGLNDLLKRQHAHAVAIGGHKVVPGEGGLLSGLGGSSGMPPALIAALASLMILCAGTAYLAVREKVPALGRALRIRGR